MFKGELLVFGGGQLAVGSDGFSGNRTEINGREVDRSRPAGLTDEQLTDALRKPDGFMRDGFYALPDIWFEARDMA